MRDEVEPPVPPGRRVGVGDIASYALITGAVVLAWQILIQPVMQRAPVETAIRVAPSSPLVLRRAAEAELVAGRNANAAALGREALARSPFDVRALRVVGLTEARAGRVAQADEILTLAGNWSLRDDPAHAWLVEYRLRRGDYASSFAHADTLVRRRKDLEPQIFRLFAVAGIEAPQQALPVLAGLLEADPQWRPYFLNSLNTSPEGLKVAASLAILLEASRTPLAPHELQRLYLDLLRNNQFEALQTVRGRLNRPPATTAVSNGDFEDSSAPEPFQWRLAQRAGVIAEIVPDDLRPADKGLRVEYDGRDRVQVAAQLIFLSVGPHRLTYEVRSEAGDTHTRFAWRISCMPGDRVIALSPAAPAAADWTLATARFDVPSDCPAQWLRLDGTPEDRRSTAIAWFDRVAVTAGSGDE